MIEREYQLARGEKWDESLRLELSGFDWTGATWTASVKASAKSKTTLASATVTTNTATLGTAVLAISLSDAQTAALPPRWVLSLTVAKAASSFGPYEVARFSFVSNN